MFDTRLPQPNGSFRWVQAAARAGARLPAARAVRAPSVHDAPLAAWLDGRRKKTTGEPGTKWPTRWREPRSCAFARCTAADVVVRRAGERRTALCPTADIIVSNDPASPLPFKPPTACRFSSPTAARARWLRRMPDGEVWLRACRETAVAPSRASSAAVLRTLWRPSGRRSAPAATRWVRTSESASPRQASPQAISTAGFLTAPLRRRAILRCRGLRQDAEAGIIGSSTAGRPTRDQLERPGCAPDQIFVAESLHGEPSRRAVFVPARRRGCRPAGGAIRPRRRFRPSHASLSQSREPRSRRRLRISTHRP